MDSSGFIDRFGYMEPERITNCSCCCCWCYDEPAHAPERRLEMKRRYNNYCCLADFIPWQMGCCQTTAYDRSAIVLKLIQCMCAFGMIQAFSVIMYTFTELTSIDYEIRNLLSLYTATVMLISTLMAIYADSLFQQKRIMCNTFLLFMSLIFFVMTCGVSANVAKDTVIFFTTDENERPSFPWSITILTGVFLAVTSLIGLCELSVIWHFTRAYQTREMRATLEVNDQQSRRTQQLIYHHARLARAPEEFYSRKSYTRAGEERAETVFIQNVEERDAQIERLARQRARITRVINRLRSTQAMDGSNTMYTASGMYREESKRGREESSYNEYDVENSMVSVALQNNGVDSETELV